MQCHIAFLPFIKVFLANVLHSCDTINHFIMPESMGKLHMQSTTMDKAKSKAVTVYLIF